MNASYSNVKFLFIKQIWFYYTYYRMSHNLQSQISIIMNISIKSYSVSVYTYIYSPWLNKQYKKYIFVLLFFYLPQLASKTAHPFVEIPVSRVAFCN